MRHPNTECATCQKSIYKRPSQITRNDGKVYCSKECFGKSCRKEVKCLVCENMILGGRHSKTCSRACANKNRTGVKYKKLGAPRKDKAKTSKILRQRLIELRGPKCEECPYDNLNVLQPHHIIERCNGGTDDIENLKLLCPNCHCTKHYGDSRILNGSVSEPGLL